MFWFDWFFCCVGFEQVFLLLALNKYQGGSKWLTQYRHTHTHLPYRLCGIYRINKYEYISNPSLQSQWCSSKRRIQIERRWYPSMLFLSIFFFFFFCAINWEVEEKGKSINQIVCPHDNHNARPSAQRIRSRSRSEKENCVTSLEMLRKCWSEHKEKKNENKCAVRITLERCVLATRSYQP